LYFRKLYFGAVRAEKRSCRVSGVRAKLPARQNPNIEIRDKPNDLDPNYEIPNGLVWNFLTFDHLKLFRILDFGFRICKCLGSTPKPETFISTISPNSPNRLDTQFLGKAPEFSGRLHAKLMHNAGPVGLDGALARS
jgi:hypothetical protein